MITILISGKIFSHLGSAVYRPQGYHCDHFLYLISECLDRLVKKQINVVIAGESTYILNIHVLVDDIKRFRML